MEVNCCKYAWRVTRNMSTVTKNMGNFQENNFWTPHRRPPPLSYHFCIWGSHMYHMDIGHVAAALGPLAYPRRSAQPPSLS